jgi:MbtH protein
MQVKSSPIYRVVINDEDQYSVWLDDGPNPPGWSGEGTVGSREECLDRIETIWTDMRPRSLRVKMDDSAATESVG